MKRALIGASIVGAGLVGLAAIALLQRNDGSVSTSTIGSADEGIADPQPHAPMLVEPETLSTSSSSADETGDQTRGVELEPESVRLERQLEDVLAGNGRIDDFIREHLDRAEAGDPDSMYFVSEAMGACHLDLFNIQSSMPFLSMQFGNVWPPTEDDWESYRQAVMDLAVHTADYSREVARLSLARAEQCSTLGLDAMTLLQGHDDWNEAAVAAHQPIAAARAAAENLADASAGALQRSKNTIRDVLRTNRRLQTLLNAASVSIHATGREPVAERLAWAVLACDYYDCEKTLTHLYRNACHIATLDGTGSGYCYVGMSDAEYLRGKYPAQIDIARGRAGEIKDALDSGRWDSLGLD